MTPLLLLLLLAQTCNTPDPFASIGGGVCVNGGWLPANHPNAKPAPSPLPDPLPPPTPPAVPSSIGVMVPPLNPPENQWIIDLVNSGHELPAGDVWFKPPLVFYGTPRVIGSGRTVLRPTTTLSGVNVFFISDMPGNGETGYPNRMEVRDIHIAGGLGQTCMLVNGAAITFERLIATGCTDLVKFSWVVNVTFSHSSFVRGGNGWNIPAGIVATTLTCSACWFAYNRDNAVYTGTAWGLLFDNWTIFEYNLQRALHIGCGTANGALRDVWFEGNGTHEYGCTFAFQRDNVVYVK